jgi:HD-GYP domain-containing protein (c-di-GMP phosphodiesterase class II)
VRRDPDIAIYLTVRQNPNRLQRYGLAHALHTALVAELAAARLAWADADRLRYVKAALTMNLAIVELQGRLAASDLRPTEAQRVELRAHPQAAVDALRAAGIDDATWFEAVLQHHERRDGSGYPAGLSDPAPLAVSLRLADVFMAKISPRASRDALTVQEAARQMFRESDGSPVAAAVVKEYGIYPPGDFVQLASGERAVVVRRGADARTPLVAAITSRTGAPIVDTLRRDTREKEHAIVGTAAERKLVVRVPPERLYGLV